MRKIILLVSFFLVFSLLSSQNLIKKIECVKQIYYGDSEICLPKIAGMTECYSVPIVQKKVSRVIDDRGMLVMGFYLTNEIYEKIDILDEIPFDGFFLIYAQENMKNIKGGIKDLEKVANLMKSSYIEFDWELDDIIIDNKMINVGKPVLLDNYSPSNEIHSFVGLTYSEMNGINYVGLSIMNMMIIKEKLITLVYYYKYEDKSSIVNAKSINDYIVLRFLYENKK